MADSSGRETEEKEEDALRHWHSENSVNDAADEAVLESHFFAKEAKNLTARTSAPVLGRMKKLVTQITSLRSSLPEGIYIRHCRSRLDVMKVLITGPKGTPYELGLFEFDSFARRASRHRHLSCSSAPLATALSGSIRTSMSAVKVRKARSLPLPLGAGFKNDKKMKNEIKNREMRN